MVNAIVALLEPSEFRELLERSLVGRVIPTMSGQWVAWVIAVHDLTIGVSLLATMWILRAATIRPRVGGSLVVGSRPRQTHGSEGLWRLIRRARHRVASCVGRRRDRARTSQINATTCGSPAGREQPRSCVRTSVTERSHFAATAHRADSCRRARIRRAALGAMTVSTVKARSSPMASAPPRQGPPSCLPYGQRPRVVRRGHRIDVEELGVRPMATARVGTVASTADETP